MKNTEKERLSNQTEKRYFGLRFLNGCRSIFKNPFKIVILLAFYGIVFLIHEECKGKFNIEEVE